MTQETSKSPWHIHGDSADGTIGRLTATLDLTRPQHGLARLSHSGQLIPDCLPLQVSPGPPSPNGEAGEQDESTESPSNGQPAIVDTYCRGEDVVVTYAKTAKPSIETTLLWRSLQGTNDLLGIELIVSVQTSLLDDDPTIAMRSDCGGTAFWVRDGKSLPITEEVWSSPRSGENADAGFLLFRLEQGLSYSEMVYLSDFSGASITKSKQGTCRLDYQLFTAGLEKGVIRRGRVRGFFLPTKDDVTTTWAAYQQFLEEKPVLTT